MPLSNVEIKEELKSGLVAITPFEQTLLQPASYDMRIGKNAATVPKNGDPRVNLEDERVLLVPGYAPAQVFTLEEIRLPLNMVGHFGVMSWLARRGLFASVGIQVDPGFEGPLSVSLINLTPNPVALNYGDPFVTLEIERLAVPASEPYSGKYQRRKNFTAQELEAVLGYKGHALSDVVEGFEEMVCQNAAIALFLSSGKANSGVHTGYITDFPQISSEWPFCWHIHAKAPLPQPTSRCVSA